MQTLGVVICIDGDANINIIHGENRYDMDVYEWLWMNTDNPNLSRMPQKMERVFY